MTHLSCITDHIANPEDMKALSSFQKSVNTQYPTANQRIFFPVKEEKQSGFFFFPIKLIFQNKKICELFSLPGALFLVSKILLSSKHMM